MSPTLNCAGPSGVVTFEGATGGGGGVGAAALTGAGGAAAACGARPEGGAFAAAAAALSGRAEPVRGAIASPFCGRLMERSAGFAAALFRELVCGPSVLMDDTAFFLEPHSTWPNGASLSAGTDPNRRKAGADNFASRVRPLCWLNELPLGSCLPTHAVMLTKCGSKELSANQQSRPGKHSAPLRGCFSLKAFL